MDPTTTAQDKPPVNASAEQTLIYKLGVAVRANAVDDIKDISSQINTWDEKDKFEIHFSLYFIERLLNDIVSNKLYDILDIVIYKAMPHCWSKQVSSYRLFYQACIMGHLDTAKEIYYYYPSIEKRSDNYSLFQRLCDDGSFQAAQYVYNLNPAGCRYPGDKCLEALCGKGLFQFVRWILTIYPDVDVGNTDVLSCACESGSYKLVEWLVTVYQGLSVSYPDDLPFKLAAKGKHFKICRLLGKHCPDYTVRRNRKTDEVEALICGEVVV